MKYIIVGLGNFGTSLSQKLTAQGNEVIGIDVRMEKVDLFKEKISHTICLDATDESAVSGLPLTGTDVVFVTIGKDQGANIMATALFKNMQAKKLISRAITPLHEKVLKAIGVDEIVHPEEETAKRWVKKMSADNVVNSFWVNEHFSVVKATVPEDYIGKTIREIDFRGQFNLLLLTVIKKIKAEDILGKGYTEVDTQGIAALDQKLEDADTLVVYGSNKDLDMFLKRR